MIENLLILLIGVAIGVGITARLERKHTGQREVRLQVHELELMTQALVLARQALTECLTCTTRGAMHIQNALSVVKLALGESNGHPPKHDDKKRAWL